MVLLCVKPLGTYMANVLEGKPDLSHARGWPRRGVDLSRAAELQPDEDMGWPQYAIALLLFNVLGALVVYGLQRLQFWLAVQPADI